MPTSPHVDFKFKNNNVLQTTPMLGVSCVLARTTKGPFLFRGWLGNLFQYDHLLSWPDRFPLPGVFPKRNTHKAFRSVDVLWTSGFFSSLFQMSARHPATVVLCFPLLPQLPVQCGHGRFPAYNTHRSLQCRLPETPTLPPQGW